MSIQVICPNGHPLNVNESCAGKTGLCPVCKARVKVPPAETRPVSEDDVLGFLGPRKAEPVASRPLSPGPLFPSPVQGTAPGSRVCARCHREIVASMHVCPFCHSYIAGLAETS